MTVLNSKEVAEYEIAMSKISCTNNNGICMHCAGVNLLDTINYQQTYVSDYRPESSKGCPFCTSDNGKNRKYCGFCEYLTHSFEVQRKFEKELSDREEQIEVLEDLIFQLRLKLNSPLPDIAGANRCVK